MNKPTEPVALLLELEAYLTFRLMAEVPTIPSDDIASIKADIRHCLEVNGIRV